MTKEDALARALIKALHFLNWNLRTKSAIEEERDKQLNSVTIKVKKESKSNENKGE